MVEAEARASSAGLSVWVDTKTSVACDAYSSSHYLGFLGDPEVGASLSKSRGLLRLISGYKNHKFIFSISKSEKMWLKLQVMQALL